MRDVFYLGQKPNAHPGERIVASLSDARKQSMTETFWIINEYCDYTGFDWEFEFDQLDGEWAKNHNNIWPSIRHTDSGTWLCNKQESEVLIFRSDVTALGVRKLDCFHDVFLIDHGNKETENTLALLQQKTKRKVSVVGHDTDYLTTFKKIINAIPIDSFHFIWVCSSICDYSTFDLTFFSDPSEITHLHVFPSNGQQYGDTFLVNVKQFKEQLASMNNLDDYSPINFNTKQVVARYSPPTLISGETHLRSIHTPTDFPYAILKTYDNQHLSIVDEVPLALWKKEQKNIKSFSTGSTVIIAPKEANAHIKHELYDYPYLSIAPKLTKSKDMEVIFMSNGETGADDRYLALRRTLGREPKWVDKVQGRENAIRKCAEISETDWVLIVPAKLEIDRKFDFSWQPDRMQEPKHYIFYATNPLNKLCYGHMAPVMYNKRLVLDTIDYGLDFTMSKKHEVVPINAGIAHYNLDPLMTWRTAFREALKLKHATDAESYSRLVVWLTEASGLNAKYSTEGAADAVDYYNEVKGDPEKLQLSFDWAWLKARYDSTYPSS